MNNLIKYGLAAGGLNVIGWFVGNWLTNDNSSISLSEYLGYVAMLLSLSLVFFGIKDYRDNELNGHISFIQGIKKGMVIVLTAAIIYVIGWEIYFPNFMIDFGEDYQNKLLMDLENQGLNAQQIASEKEKLANWLNNYQNPFIRIGLTFSEIFPVGLIVTLISSSLLSKKSNE